MEVYFTGNRRSPRTTRASRSRPTSGQGGRRRFVPPPFDLFLISLGTCAGIFVLEFMQKRELDTSDTRVLLSMERDPESHLISKITMEIKLPADFPEKYKAAVIRAAELCTVKRHLMQPPAFDITTTIG